MGLAGQCIPILQKQKAPLTKYTTNLPTTHHQMIFLQGQGKRNLNIQNDLIFHTFSISSELVAYKWITYNLSSAQVLRPNYPFHWFTWDIPLENIEDGVEEVSFSFKTLTGTNVEIKLEDKRLSCNRPSMDSKFYSSGSEIKLDLGKPIQYCCHDVVFIQGTKSSCFIQ